MRILGLPSKSLQTVLFLLFTASLHAQAVLTVRGTSDGVAFRILTPLPITTGGLNGTFGITVLALPSGYACTPGNCQGAYGAPGGQVRLTTNSVDVDGASSQGTFTFFFPQFVHAGYYIAPGGGGNDAGTLLVSGIDATAGSPQSTPINTPFPAQLEATVTDPTGAYVSGVTVTFTAPGAGPSATFPVGNTAVTDSSGRARVAVTANATAGAYQIIASATVGGNAVQFPFVLANVNTANASGACVVLTGVDDLSAGSLRSLIATCGKGGTITFGASGTVSISGQFVDIPLTQDITIDGAGAVTISPNSTRAFFIHGGAITLKNLTFDGGGVLGGAGGWGASGSGAGGGGAGMGGTIFQNGGSLTLNSVTIQNSTATGGNAGQNSIFLAGVGGGGGFAGPAGTGFANGSAGNGGGGSDFGTSGGGGNTAGPGGSGQTGSGGGGSSIQGGSAGFGGGGGGAAIGFGGLGGFGGGSGGSASGSPGAFGGRSDPFSGGGAAGLGGAVFVNAGTLSLVNTSFISNITAGGSGFEPGQGKGGALFINSGATATYTGPPPTFSQNQATNAGSGTSCSSVVGAGAQDTVDVCGILTSTATHFSISAVTPANAGTPSSFTVTALDSNNATATGYTGTVHFSTTDPGSPTVPANYTFTGGDAGVHTFANGVTFHTAGTQTITATDISSLIAGTSNGVTVNPGPVHTITVSSPTPEVPGVAFNITVGLKDNFNNAIASSSDTFQYSSTDGSASLPASGGVTAGNVSVTLNTKGTQTITLTDTTQSVSGVSNNITVTAQPATITASFSPSPMQLSGSTILTITVTNPNTIPLTHVAFSNTTPAGLALVTQTGGTCATFAGTGGGSGILNPPNSFSATSNSLAAGASCNVTLRYSASATGSYVDTTSTVTADQSISAGTAASANLTVQSAPTISKSFSPSTILAGQTSQLSFTVTNTDTSAAATGVAFTDTLPAGMTVTTPNGLTGSCGGGTITAPAGAGNLGLSNATLAASASCTFSFTVNAAAGIYINTTGPVTSTNEGTGNTATATLTVLVLPSITKTFGNGGTTPLASPDSLTFTITNANPATALTGVQFTDTFPSGLIVATPNGLTGSCGAGTITATAGSGSVSLSITTIAAASSCTFSVNVTGAAGVYSNSVTVSSSNAGVGITSSATLTIVAPPSISKNFGTATILPNGVTSLSFSITNPNAVTPLTGVGFTDTLPTGMLVATPNGLTGSCGGGTITATAGSGSVTLSGATLAPASSCTFSVQVLAGAPGSLLNTTNKVTSVEGATGNVATATLTVVGGGSGLAPSPLGGGLVVRSALGKVIYFDAAYNKKYSFGSTGTGNGQFNPPSGVAVAPNGYILVTDAGNNRIVNFDPNINFRFNVGAPGVGNGQLESPTGIAITSAGLVWVVDTLNNRIEVFDANGNYRFKFGTLGTGHGQFNAPSGIALLPNGNVAVSDSGNSRVQVFDSNGTYKFQFGVAGSGNGQLSIPAGIATDAAGNFLVADMGNNRVQVFDSTGNYRFKFGTPGAGNGQFSGPTSVMVVPGTGYIWVLDEGNNRIEVFDNNAIYRLQFPAVP